MPSTPLHHVVYKGQQAAERGAPLLLLLHGYGSNEEDLVGLAPHLDGRFVCASARAPHALDFGGFAWFSIEWGPEGVRFDYEEALQSLQQIYELLQGLCVQYAPERVIVAGFSQGANACIVISKSAAVVATGTTTAGGKPDIAAPALAYSLDFVVCQAVVARVVAIAPAIVAAQSAAPSSQPQIALAV